MNTWHEQDMTRGIARDMARGRGFPGWSGTALPSPKYATARGTELDTGLRTWKQISWKERHRAPPIARMAVRPRTRAAYVALSFSTLHMAEHVVLMLPFVARHALAASARATLKLRVLCLQSLNAQRQTPSQCTEVRCAAMCA